jgi:hypothetical protein
MQHANTEKPNQTRLRELRCQLKLQNIYGFIAGTDYDPSTIGTSMQTFKDSLSCGVFQAEFITLRKSEDHGNHSSLFDYAGYAARQ